MKKYILIAALAALIVPVAALATTAGNQLYVLDPSATTDNDLIKAAESVLIEGVVKGDAMLAGGNVKSTGTIEGDLLSAGGNITVSGTVGQNLRIAGGNIEIDNVTNRNLSVAGGNVKFANSAKVLGNVYIAGGEVTIRGEILGNVYVAAGTVDIEGVVGGNVIVMSEDVEILGNTQIAGNLEYSSNKEAYVSEAATIGGTITRKDLPASTMPTLHLGKSFTFASLIYFIISTLLVILVLWKLAPALSSSMVVTTEEKFWKRLLVGLIAIIVWPLVAIVVAITLVGIPLFIGAMALYVLALIAGYAYGVVMFGVWVFKLFQPNFDVVNNQNLRFFLIVAVVFSVIRLVPVVGALLSLVTMLWGFGALVSHMQDKMNHKKEEPKMPEQSTETPHIA